jgi:hypothetical protein
MAYDRVNYCDMFASEITSTTGDQIEDEDDQRYNQQKVNQATGDMEAETQ